MNSARTASNPISGISAFLARGGFIYMDSGMRFIAATAMSTAMANPQMLLTGQHGKLNFGLPITRFPHEIDRQPRFLLHVRYRLKTYFPIFAFWNCRIF